MSLKLFHTSVNKTAMQNVQQYHFPESGGGGGCGPNLPTEVVEIPTLYKLMKMIDSSLPPVTHIVYGSHSQKLSYPFCHKQDIKNCF
jgi:hypothetical protein